MKDESNEYEKTNLIAHVIKSDRWIIDSDFSHHVNGDTSKCETLKHYNGSFFRFGHDAPCFVKGKGSDVIMHIGLID